MGRSRSWTEALKSRIEIRKLMEFAENQSDQLEKDRQLSDQENQLRLTMVALIGQFQAYIGDLLNELCDKLPGAWDTNLPLFQKRYALVQLHRRLSLILQDREESELVEDSKLEKFREEVLDCTSWVTRPISLAISGHREDLRGFLKDNGSNALNKAISQFGANQLQFSGWLHKNYPRYREAFGQLDDVIQLRNDVAHGKIEKRITFREARIYIILVYRLMLKADEYLELSFMHQGTPKITEATTPDILPENIATDATTTDSLKESESQDALH
ncbi:MAG: HEPN domain-containing protein [Rhodospirillales bacterium]|nr:HEPN domain-containing protein [Rhodospirillales bacterium]